MEKRKATPIPEGKVIVLRFHGGPRDGQTARSDDPRSPTGWNEALSMWVGTKGAPIGSAMQGGSPDLMQQAMEVGGQKFLEESGPVPWHRYEVTERQETDDEIAITLTHKGTVG